MLLNLLSYEKQQVSRPMLGASGCAEDLSAPSRLRLRVRPEAVLNINF